MVCGDYARRKYDNLQAKRLQPEPINSARPAPPPAESIPPTAQLPQSSSPFKV